MSAQQTTVAVAEAEAARAPSDHPDIQDRFGSALDDVDDRVREELLKGLGVGLGLGPAQSPDGLTAFLRSADVSPGVRATLAMALEEVSTAFTEAASKLELGERMDALEASFRRGFAEAAESISAKNARRERELRNIEVVLRTASTGRTDAENALVLEVFNLDAQQLIGDPDAWDDFVERLRDRQKNSIQCDVGYNFVGLPIEIGDPDAPEADLENTADLVMKLAELGKEINTVFFLDLKPAGIEALASGRPDRKRISNALTRTLENASWDEKDKGRLGPMLRKRMNGNDVSRFVVLNGGVPLIAERLLDGDLGAAQRPVFISPSAAAIGGVAWSAGGGGPPVMPTGSAQGKGGLVGINKIGMVPLQNHQFLARRGGVNTAFVSERPGAASLDSSLTLGGADPKFSERRGAFTVESVVVAQWIQRLATRFIRQLSPSDNTKAGRQTRIVEPVKRELEKIKAAGVLRTFDVRDADVTGALQDKGQVKIDVEYVEVTKIDQATVNVKRTFSSSQDGDLDVA